MTRMGKIRILSNDFHCSICAAEKRNDFLSFFKAMFFNAFF